MQKLQKKVDEAFIDAFGVTPLTLRLEDIQSETMELVRYTSVNNIKEEAGDLGASLIQLCNENGWDFQKLVEATLSKIERRKIQYKSLGRKAKVAIFGGAFDPIHNGHIAVAKYILDTSKTFDEVWLMPCFKHLYGKQMTDYEDRLFMCRMAAQVDPRIKVSDFERDLSGETLHLVQQLMTTDDAYNKYDFSLVIGMDNALKFENWVGHEHLEKMIRFVVVPRKGISVSLTGQEWFLKPPHIFLGLTDYANTLIEISSSKIKEDMNNGVRPAELHVEVFSYLIANKLYQVE